MRNGWKFQSQGTCSRGPSGGNNKNGKAGGLISPDGKAVIPELKKEVESKPSEDEEMEEERRRDEELLEPFRESEPSVSRELDIQVPKGIIRSEGVAGGHSSMEYESGMTLTVDGETISEQSTIHKLREVCVKLGLSPSGGKKKLFLKIFHFMKDSKEEEVTEIAERFAKPKRGVNVRPGCEEPTKQEIEEHLATHLPMKPWCEFCLAAKSKQDRVPTYGDVKYEDPGEPCIQMDYMFMGQPCATLVILDSWTRYAQALPLQGKTVSKKLAEAVVKFSLHLNYVQENVHFAMDVEPATKALLDMARWATRPQFVKASHTIKVGQRGWKGTSRI